MRQEELLKLTGLSIFIAKALKTDVLVKVTPMYAVEAKAVLITFVIRRIQ